MHACMGLALRCWVRIFLRGRNGGSVIMMLTTALGALQESGKEVDTLNEERGQKVNKLKIVEKERANLSSAKEEAEEFMSLQRKLVCKKSVLYQVRTLSQSNVAMRGHHYRHLVASHRMCFLVGIDGPVRSCTSRTRARNSRRLLRSTRRSTRSLCTRRKRSLRSANRYGEWRSFLDCLVLSDAVEVRRMQTWLVS